MQNRLYIGNKNYSSWSMIVWLAMKIAQINFIEEVIPLGVSGYKRKILDISQAGYVPVLSCQDGGKIWDSLAIIDYIVSQSEYDFYPASIEYFAMRSYICEIHSGFLNIRKEMPFNIHMMNHNITLSKQAEHELKRIKDIISFRLENIEFKYNILDIFLSHFIARFNSYNISSDEKNIYSAFIKNNEYYQSWQQRALSETWTIEKIENFTK